MTPGVIRQGAAVRERAAERDRAISALFVQHYDRLRRLAYVLLGDGTHAEEIVMDCFAKALSKWSLLRSADEPPLYLRKMVVNACRSKQRRAGLEARTTALFRRRDERSDALDVEHSGVALDVWAAVRDLPQRQRVAVALRYLEDLPEAEIAAAMDCPVGTVKSLLSRARRVLSTRLGPEFFGGEAS